MSKHKCYRTEGTTESGYYMSATDLCNENYKGELWSHVGAHSIRVNHCPYCGLKAYSQIPAPADSGKKEAI